MKQRFQWQPLYIGIDVSKLTLDVSGLSSGGTHHYHQFENSKAGLRSLNR
jgi:transposase